MKNSPCRFPAPPKIECMLSSVFRSPIAGRAGRSQPPVRPSEAPSVDARQGRWGLMAAGRDPVAVAGQQHQVGDGDQSPQEPPADEPGTALRAPAGTVGHVGRGRRLHRAGGVERRLQSLPWRSHPELEGLGGHCAPPRGSRFRLPVFVGCGSKPAAAIRGQAQARTDPTPAEAIEVPFFQVVARKPGSAGGRPCVRQSATPPVPIDARAVATCSRRADGVTPRVQRRAPRSGAA